MYQIAGVRKNDAGQHQECYLANFDRWTFDEKEARLFDTCIRANQHAAHLRWNEHGRTSVRVEPAHPIADEDTRHEDMIDAALYAKAAQDMHKNRATFTYFYSGNVNSSFWNRDRYRK